MTRLTFFPLLLLACGCATLPGSSEYPDSRDLSRVCFSATKVAECSDEYWRHSRDPTPSSSAQERLWWGWFLVHRELRPRVLRELDVHVAELSADSIAAGVLEEACYGGDVLACHHLARTDTAARRAHWADVLCQAGDVDACLALPEQVGDGLAVRPGACSADNVDGCHQRAALEATSVRSLDSSCREGSRHACWQLVSKRASFPQPDAVTYLEGLEAACTCGSDLTVQRACRTIRRELDLARQLEKSDRAIVRCAADDRGGCDDAARLVETNLQPNSPRGRELRSLQKVLLKRACRGAAPDSCPGKPEQDPDDPARRVSWCTYDGWDKTVCPELARALVEGRNGAAPNPVAAEPLLERGCREGQFDLCALWVESQPEGSRLETRWRSCRLGSLAQCQELANHSSYAARANRMGCRLGDAASCLGANIPLEAECLRLGAVVHPELCLMACRDGSNESCEQFARLARPNDLQYLRHLVHKGNHYDDMKDLASAATAACHRGSLMSCSLAALLIRTGTTDEATANAIRDLKQLEALSPEQLEALRVRWQECRAHPRRDCDAHRWDFLDPQAVSSWTKRRDNARKRADELLSTAHTKHEASCQTGVAASCGEVGQYELYVLSKVEGRTLREEVPRWRAARAKLVAACDAGSRSACARLTFSSQDGTHETTRATRLGAEKSCLMGLPGGCFAIAATLVRERASARELVAWYERGCALGDAEACEKAGELWFRGDADMRPDAARARAAFHWACDLGQLSACYEPSRAECERMFR